MRSSSRSGSRIVKRCSYVSRRDGRSGRSRLRQRSAACWRSRSPSRSRWRSLRIGAGAACGPVSPWSRSSGLLLTASATAVAALAAAVALAIVVWGRVDRRVLGFGAVLVALALTAVVSQRAERLLDPWHEKSPWRLRAGNYRAAVSMAAEHPWVGVGPGGFAEAYPRYRRAGDNETRHAHSLPLELTAEAGFVAGTMGSLAFLAIFLGPLRIERRAFPWRRGIAVGLAAFAIHNLADFTAFMPSLLWTAALLRGWLVLSTPVPARRFAPSSRVLAAGALALVLAASTVSMLAGYAVSERRRARTAAFDENPDGGDPTCRARPRLRAVEPGCGVARGANRPTRGRCRGGAAACRPRGASVAGSSGRTRAPGPTATRAGRRGGRGGRHGGGGDRVSDERRLPAPARAAARAARTMSGRVNGSALDLSRRLGAGGDPGRGRCIAARPPAVACGAGVDSRGRLYRLRGSRDEPDGDAARPALRLLPLSWPSPSPVRCGVPYAYGALLVVIELAAWFAVALLAARAGRGVLETLVWPVRIWGAFQGGLGIVQWAWLDAPRPTGTFLVPNHYALWLACAFVIGAAGLRRDASGAARASAIGAGLVAAVGLSLSGSRGGLLAALAGSAILCAMLWHRISARVRWAIVGAAALLVVIAGLAYGSRLQRADPFRYQRVQDLAGVDSCGARGPVVGNRPRPVRRCRPTAPLCRRGRRLSLRPHVHGHPLRPAARAGRVRRARGAHGSVRCDARRFRRAASRCRSRTASTRQASVRSQPWRQSRRMHWSTTRAAGRRSRYSPQCSSADCWRPRFRPRRRAAGCCGSF